MRILIAEDVRHTGQQYKIMLEENNHNVTITENGSECIKQYKDAIKNSSGKDPFDVVVLDYRLPEKDGLKTAKEILHLKKDQRIIFASAFVKEALMDASNELGRKVEIIEKPFELEEFVSLIER